MGFSLPSTKCSVAPPSFRLLPSTVSLSELYSTIWFPHARQVRVESICPQSTQLVSILYLCYGFSSHAYLLYAFSGYAFLRYAYLRFSFSRYAYLGYVFSRYAFLRYAFSRYAFLRYAYLRYAFSRSAYFRYAFLPYAFSRYVFSRYAFYHSVCLSAFWLAAWYLKRVFALQLRFDAFPIWNIESACCYSALDWCIYNLDNLISIPGYWILS